MYPVAQVPLDWYISNILPPLPAEANIDSILESLSRSSKISRDVDESLTTWLSDGIEVEILECLCVLFDTVVDTAKEQMERVGHCRLQSALSLQMHLEQNEGVDILKPTREPCRVLPAAFDKSECPYSDIFKFRVNDTITPTLTDYWSGVIVYT